ncbi:MAG: ACT domain-containing protein [Candidatus Marinimicrobia bacterium]|nr:ACT domain-containing protein [Candidatus Neomarinimicrobiota bacterium]RKY57175.1 MAG: hypothetical protein DRP96_10420 [Candidatus Neomarinimicrobiota bacterium]
MTEKIKIGGILETRNLVMISILSAPNQPGVAGKVLTVLGKNNINIEFITESENLEGTADITFCIKSSDKDKVRYLLSGMRGIVRARGDKWYEHVMILVVYGPHFREKPTISGKMCEQLGKYNINILGISTSISSISCIINESDYDNAMKSLLEAFELPE